MQKTLERIRLVLTLDKRGIDVNFANVYDGKLLLARMADLEKADVPQTYAKQGRIQEELIKNELFTDYYCQLSKAEIPPHEIEKMLTELLVNDDSITNFDYEHVLRTLKNTGLTMKYDFLKYFIHRPLSQEAFELVSSNLNNFYTQKSTSFCELSEAEREIFLEPYISRSYLIPIIFIKRVCELLTTDENIRGIIQLLYDNEIKTTLEIQHYESMAENSLIIYEGLAHIISALPREAMLFTVSQWVENGCEAYDIGILKKKVSTVPQEELTAAVASRSGYINLLYGNRIKNIELQNEPYYSEELLIYAITHKKTSFIKLIEDNHEVFASMPSTSVVFKKEFYSKYVNINSMNINNLRDCAKMKLNVRQWDINSLGDATYTFEEFQTLYGLSWIYAALYNKLTLPKIDSKLIVLRQLLRKELLTIGLQETDVDILAEKLSIKPLSRWIETDFKHITGLQSHDAIRLLLVYGSVEKFISQITSRIEALYIIQNVDYVQDFSSLDEIKNKCLEIDTSWAKLRQAMGFGDSFVSENSESIINFILRGSANIAFTYYNNIYSQPT